MRRYRKDKPAANEFDEIKNLKARGEKVISRDDISDFQIDFGLWNKKLEKELDSAKKASVQKRGKRKCAARKSGKSGKEVRKSRKVVKKSTATCQSTKGFLKSGVSNTE